MKKILLLVLFILGSSLTYSQPELFNSASPFIPKIRTELPKILFNRDIKKIVEKRNISRKVIKFDTVNNEVFINNKIFFINYSKYKYTFQNEQELKAIRSSGHGLIQPNLDLFYSQLGDTTFIYASFDSDTILSREIIEVNDSLRTTNIYVIGEDGKYSEYYVIKSKFDTQKRLASVSFLDTTLFNHYYVSFTGIYNDHDDIIEETLIKQITPFNKAEETKAVYKYRYNNKGNWVRKKVRIKDGKSKTIKRRYRYY